MIKETFNFSSLNAILPASVSVTEVRVIEVIIDADVSDLPEDSVRLRVVDELGRITEVLPLVKQSLGTNLTHLRFEPTSNQFPVALVFYELSDYDTATLKVDNISATGSASITDGYGVASLSSFHLKGVPIETVAVALV